MPSLIWWLYLVSVSSCEWRCPVVAITILSPTSQSTACWRVRVVDPAVAVDARRVQVTFGLPEIKSKASHLKPYAFALIIFKFLG